MKKLLLFVIACTLGLFTVNAQNRLESITSTNTGDNLTYVYEEGTNKVVRIDKGVDQGWGQYTTFLTYDANGLLKSTEYIWAQDGVIEEGYKETSSYSYTVVEYTYTDGKLTSYKSTDYTGWWPYEDIEEYTLVYDGDKVTAITFEGSSNNTRIIYEYENDKLVSETKLYFNEWAEPEPGDEVDYSIVYTYDEAGNCVSAAKTQWGNTEVTSYIYDVTKLATDVYSFAFPHEVKPVSTNIIATATTGETVATYNYSFATIAAPVAPAGLTAEVLSDTEVALAWNAVEGAEVYKIYNGAELAAESSETAYTVTGLTAETEYTFTVTAVNEGGESEASNEAKATTLKAVEIAPEAIAFGEVTVGGEYWSKAGATRELSIKAFGKEVKSITVDNAFFVLPTIDLTAEVIEFAVGYDFNGTAAEQEGTITITLANDATYTVPVTATAYAPVAPDVFELAQEITFTDGVYTNTPDFATLHDNYLDAPDAVYSFTLEDNQAVEVHVAGKNAKHAVYAEDDYTTSLQRTEKILSTTFSYDFNEGELDDFIVEDYDEYQDYTWELEEDGEGYYLVSYSHIAEYVENDYVTYLAAADERIITKAAYAITEHSVLAMDINVNGMYGDTVAVEITKDGKNFVQVGVVGDDEYTYSYDWLAKKVNIGARMAELGLEFGEYQISLYHKAVASRPFFIDNLSLTERGLVYPAGNYYLVAAADSTFTVEVKSVDYDGDEYIEPVKPAPAAPVVEATEVGKTSVVLTWAAVETATSYTVYQGADSIANVTKTTYTVEGLEEDTEYSFTVTATNENGESEASNVVTVKTEKTEIPVTAAPEVYVVQTTETTIVFAWAPVEGAVSYNVYAEGELAGNIKDTIAGLQMLEPNTEYCFTVTAINSAGVESLHSEEVCATTKPDAIAELEATFNVYPNPVNDKLYIETETEIKEVVVYDVYGRRQVSETPSQQGNLVVDVANLNSGVYFVKVVTENGEAVKRIVKN